MYLLYLCKKNYFCPSKMSQVCNNKYMKIKITSNLIIRKTTTISNLLSVLSHKYVHIYLSTYMPFKNGIILNYYITCIVCITIWCKYFSIPLNIKHSYTNTYTKYKYKTDIKQMVGITSYGYIKIYLN